MLLRDLFPSNSDCHQLSVVLITPSSSIVDKNNKPHLLQLKRAMSRTGTILPVDQDTLIVRMMVVVVLLLFLIVMPMVVAMVMLMMMMMG